MDGQELELAGERLVARASGVLWWPMRRLACVADLHLGKSERMARRAGALLPPYETAETLGRLAAELAALGSETVVCLGDSFDDRQAEAALAAGDRAALAGMMAGRRWIWVAGNHDPGAVPEVAAGDLRFRHVAVADAAPGEVSGHYHPKLRLAARGRSVSRRCFVHDRRRLILPAFGAYTGGLDADGPVLRGLFGAGAMAVLAGDPCVRVPLDAGAESRARPGVGRLRL